VAWYNTEVSVHFGCPTIGGELINGRQQKVMARNRARLGSHAYC
jgi:hypothetical protein